MNMLLSHHNNRIAHLNSYPSSFTPYQPTPLAQGLRKCVVNSTRVCWMIGRLQLTLICVQGQKLPCVLNAWKSSAFTSFFKHCRVTLELMYDGHVVPLAGISDSPHYQRD